MSRDRKEKRVPAKPAMAEDQKRTLSMLSPITAVQAGIIVPRTNLPEQLHTEIMPADPVKIFVAGQRGMGKTTELKRFVDILEDSDFVPVFLQFGSQQSISHAGLINAMAQALYATEGIDIDNKSFERLQEWYDTEEATTVMSESSGSKASLGGSYVILSASGEIAHTKTKNTKKTRTVEKGIVDLVGRFNSFVEKTAKTTRKRIVFIVDDIDKVQDSDSINSTFIHASHIIGNLNCACIFTVPITYATSNYVRIAGLPYNGIIRVPAVDLFDEKGNRNSSSQDFMRKVFELRMPYNPIPSQLLDKVLDFSGGVLIDAMRMLRGICKQAIMEPNLVVNDIVIQEEFQKLVDDYQFVIDRRPLWDALGHMCRGGASQTLAADGIMPELLYKMIAIEYFQKRTWFQPHPAARLLYEQSAHHLSELKDD